MHPTIRIKASEEFADILLAKELNVQIINDGKYFLFSSGIQRDEYDRRRRERKRENERVREGVPGDSPAATRSERIKRGTSYNFSRVPRRPAR